MSGARRTFRRRPGFGKIIVQWLGYVFLLVSIVALGYFAWVHADIFMFQAYESWKLDRMQQQKPASVGAFLKDQVPLLREEAPSGENVIRRPARGGEDQELPHRGTPPHHHSLFVENGSLIGRIRIPRLHLSAIVMEGVDSRTLRHAVGHMPGSALPGDDAGNVDLAGHRDTFFHGLMHVKHGDLITVSIPSGETYDYRVSSVEVLPPDAMRTINGYRGPGLNLITCYPFYYVGPAPKRYVVHAEELKTSDEKRSAENDLNEAAAPNVLSVSLNETDPTADDPAPATNDDHRADSLSGSTKRVAAHHQPRHALRPKTLARQTPAVMYYSPRESRYPTLEPRRSSFRTEHDPLPVAQSRPYPNRIHRLFSKLFHH